MSRRGRREREQGARTELPRAGRGDEVGKGWVDSRDPERVARGRHGDGCEDAEHDLALLEPREAARRQPQPEQHQQWPEQVELLLRRERPVVLRGRGSVVSCEVVHRVDRERPVHDVQRRRQDLAEELLPHQPRHEEEDADGRDQEHDVRRGQQPAQPPGPEPGQAHRARAIHLAEDVGGDQVAGDDEEDVDADVTARHPVGPEVEQDDQKHCHCPKALDLLAHQLMLQTRQPGSGDRAAQVGGSGQAHGP